MAIRRGGAFITIHSTRPNYAQAALEISPPAWMRDAACVDVGGDLWFPEQGESATAAKKVCGACPVRLACLAYAVQNSERWGVWGGTSERERRRLEEAS